MLSKSESVHSSNLCLSIYPLIFTDSLYLQAGFMLFCSSCILQLNLFIVLLIFSIEFIEQSIASPKYCPLLFSFVFN